jgi:hypothetical protein
MHTYAICWFASEGQYFSPKLACIFISCDEMTSRIHRLQVCKLKVGSDGLVLQLNFKERDTYLGIKKVELLMDQFYKGRYSLFTSFCYWTRVFVSTFIVFNFYPFYRLKCQTSIDYISPCALYLSVKLVNFCGEKCKTVPCG